MRNDHQTPTNIESYRTAPDKSDFNFYMKGRPLSQIEEEIAELFIGFGYSIVILSVMLVIGTIYQVAG
ncbi:hypothetical protein IT413_01560 [Candidatus Peregrinibacteria bacterium]|nr:hypothetical protein [Candidatus Peregrinibacteria bacterium]